MVHRPQGDLAQIEDAVIGVVQGYPVHEHENLSLIESPEADRPFSPVTAGREDAGVLFQGIAAGLQGDRNNQQQYE